MTSHVMATRRNAYPKPSPRAKRISGVCADAEALGCTRDHLTLVVRGKRQSRSLLARYQQLKASKAQAALKTPKTKSLRR